jgi:hypothetical protein
VGIRLVALVDNFGGMAIIQRTLGAMLKHEVRRGSIFRIGSPLPFAFPAARTGPQDFPRRGCRHATADANHCRGERGASTRRFIHHWPDQRMSGAIHLSVNGLAVAHPLSPRFGHDYAVNEIRPRSGHRDVAAIVRTLLAARGRGRPPRRRKGHESCRILT